MIKELLLYLTRDDASPTSAGYFKLIAVHLLHATNHEILEHVKKSPEMVAVVAHFVRWTFSSKVPASSSFLVQNIVSFYFLWHETCSVLIIYFFSG